MMPSFFRRWFHSPAAPVPESLEIQAERGDANAQFSLGFKFANRKQTKPDYAQAARWYLKAAEQSHALAQFNLGVMYAEGHGMPADKYQSMLWLGRAAELGDAAAQYRLGITHHRASMEQFPVNASESRIEAYKWLHLANAKGYLDSGKAWTLVIMQMTRVAGFVAAPSGATVPAQSQPETIAKQVPK
jgi:TPR repeat protein